MVSKINKYFRFVLLPSFLIIVISYCTPKKVLDDQTALIVLDKNISVNDFRIQYELDPTFPSYKTGTAGLMEFAEKTAARILAAELAEKEGVFEEAAAQYALDYRRKIAAVRSFYKAQISKKIVISEDELQAAFLAMSARVQLKQLYTPDEHEAQQLYSELRRGALFDSLAERVFKGVEREGKSPADLGLVSWSELDQSLENTAFSLKPGEFSQPLHSRWGYHILYVTARHELFVPSGDEFERRKQTLHKLIKRKKEEKAAAAYLKEYLSPLDIKLKNNVFLKMSSALNIESEKAGPKSEVLLNDQEQPSISNAQIEYLEQLFREELSEPFLTSRAETWSVQKFLDILKRVPFYKRPKIVSLKRFKDDIGIVIQNEFLYQRAVEQGHQKNAFVDSTVNVFAEETAYLYYLKQYYLAVDVPQDVLEYFENNKENARPFLSKPQKVLNGMQDLNQFKSYYAAQNLHKDLFEKFLREDVQFNVTFLKMEADQINWNNPIRVFIPDNY